MNIMEWTMDEMNGKNIIEWIILDIEYVNMSQMGIMEMVEYKMDIMEMIEYKMDTHVIMIMLTFIMHTRWKIIF